MHPLLWLRGWRKVYQPPMHSKHLSLTLNYSASVTIICRPKIHHISFDIWQKQARNLLRISGSRSPVPAGYVADSFVLDAPGRYGIGAPRATGYINVVVPVGTKITLVLPKLST